MSKTILKKSKPDALNLIAFCYSWNKKNYEHQKSNYMPCMK